MNYKSVVKNHNDFDYYVGVSKKAKIILNKTIKDERLKIYLVEDILEDKFNESSLFNGIAIYTYARFFVKEIFNKDFENGFTYIDPDTLIINEINLEDLNSENNLNIDESFKTDIPNI